MKKAFLLLLKSPKTLGNCGRFSGVDVARLDVVFQLFRCFVQDAVELPAHDRSHERSENRDEDHFGRQTHFRLVVSHPFNLPGVVGRAHKKRTTSCFVGEGHPSFIVCDKRFIDLAKAGHVANPAATLAPSGTAATVLMPDLGTPLAQWLTLAKSCATTCQTRSAGALMCNVLANFML